MFEEGVTESLVYTIFHFTLVSQHVPVFCKEIQFVRIAVKPVIRRLILYPHACQCEAGETDGQTHYADR